jgi:CubicO group peptidase (beta-lactamase class C family)
MAIMILAEKGKISYDDKVKDLLPNHPKNLKDIKLRQLLNHTSGILDNEYYKLVNPNNKKVLETLFKNETTEIKSGEFFRYSNSGYVLLALIVEEVSKKPIEEFYKKEIFEPLNMESTTAKKAEVKGLKNLVTGYSLTGEKSVYESSVVGPSGIYSTLNELEKWNKALNNNELVTYETLQEAFINGNLNKNKISIKMFGEDYGYGFGWAIQNKNNKKYVNHDGFVDGFRTLIKKNLTDGYDYILLTNHGSKLAMPEIISGIDTILEKGKYRQPLIPVINQILSKIASKEISDISEDVYNNVIENNLNFNERSLNRLAYKYLRKNRLKVAIQVFELNTKLFPESSNTYDGLGEAYFNDKQYNSSKRHYQKSLELNPKNENAIMMLNNIENL